MSRDPTVGRNTESADAPDRRGRAARGLVAVLVGLALAVLIWVVTTYNNCILAASNISDSYLPAIVVLLTLALVLGVNPLIRCIRPHLALSTSQLATIVGIMLVACVLPGQGLMRMLPYMIGNVPRVVSADKPTADRYERLHLPAPLFPEPLQYGTPTPVCDDFRGELPENQPIPWAAWLPPLASWGTLLLAAWLMMIGLSMIVLPQWRENERLAFPLVTVQHALIESPRPGRLVAPLFRSRAFWVAAASVFLVQLLNGSNAYFPERVPAIPLQWNLRHLFTEWPWQYMPGHIHSARVYLLFIGVTFFMPNRISFSVWFFILAYAMWRAFAPVAVVPFFIDKMDDQRIGALIVLGIFVIWVGRSHWGRVLGGLFRPVRTPADRRDRYAGWAFVIGLAGLAAWFKGVGVQFAWAVVLAGFIFLIALVVNRFVAETGLPFIRIWDQPLSLMRLGPIHWLTPVTAYMAVLVEILFSEGSRVNPAAMVSTAMALDDEGAGQKAPFLGKLFLGVLLLGLLTAGAVHLYVGYRYDGTLDHRQQPVNPGGRGMLWNSDQAAKEVENGQLSENPYNRWGHLTFGAIVAAVCYSACLAMPRWPFHPMGILLIDSYFGHEIWASVLLGWIIKAVLVRFGGSRLYGTAKPFFLGVIVGDVFAAAFWTLVPAVLAALGMNYVVFNVLPA